MRFLIYFSVYLLFLVANGFNISPKPNYEFRPRMITADRRSSYFGYSLKLKENSLIVGAPRLNYTAEQFDLKESGMIYKCYLAKNDQKIENICDHYIFDKYINVNETGVNKLYNKDRNNQWLGAVIDGGSSEMDPLIVCAPRLSGFHGDEKTMHGICYTTKNTSEKKPVNIDKISLLNDKAKQVEPVQYCPIKIKIKRNCEPSEVEYNNIPHYLEGQQGFSVHWVAETNDYLMGAPGVSDWRGSVIRYKSMKNFDVPNPNLFNDPTLNAYFGYSVSSGYFTYDNKKELFFIGSAPHKEQVFIFKIHQAYRRLDKTISKFYVFKGEQFGDYYGYSILTDDFNNDGWTDVVISAPFHKNKDSFDSGIVYVYINQKNPRKLSFKEYKITPKHLSSGIHFGTTLTKLGDINQDSFNDLAISAPFNKNGTVYIYLGDSNGIQMKPSQILKAPKVEFSFIANISKTWFGFGLSGNADFDGNGFNDLAIGSPNSEIAYIYKAYPVVKIVVSYEIEKYELKSTDKNYQLKLCYLIESKHSKIHNFDLILKLEVDIYWRRIKFENDQSTIEMIRTGLKQKKCENVSLSVNLSNNFKSVKIKTTFELKDKIDSNKIEFCNECGITDPSDLNSIDEELYIATGCETEICYADLTIITPEMPTTYIIGTSKNLTVKYVVRNEGENAYSPKLHIKSNFNLKYLKIHQDCQLKNSELICNLAPINGYMEFNEMREFDIIFDTSTDDIEFIKNFNITAKVTSAGYEKNSTNNLIENIIKFEHFSEIEITSSVLSTVVKIADNDKGISKVFNTLQVKNYGPSSASHTEIYIIIPMWYWNGDKYIKIIDNIGSLQNDLSDSIDSNVETSSQIKYDDNQNSNLDKIFGNDTEIFEEEFFENQTLTIECANQLNRHRCEKIIIDFWEFDAYTEQKITFYFEINHKEMNRILNKKKNVMSIEIDVKFKRKYDDDISTLNVFKLLQKNYVLRYRASTPIWIYVVAAFIGLLVLILLTYGLYKFGFFKRAKKEELKKIIRESQRYSKLPRLNTGLMEVMSSEPDSE